MLIESCQLLATAHHHYGNGANVTYKPTHKNHPSAVWVRQSVLHYKYLVDLACGLGAEFYKRYGKRHKCGELFDLLSKPPRNIAVGPLTQFPQAMPEDCKRERPVDGYRAYYINHKARFAKWTNRSVPDWFTCS